MSKEIKVLRCKKQFKPVLSNELCPDFDPERLSNGRPMFYTKLCKYCIHSD